MGNLAGNTHFKECPIKQICYLLNLQLEKGLYNQLIKSTNGGRMVKRELEVGLIDKDGKWYPLNEVNSAELAEALEKISKEIAKRLALQKEQR